MEPIIAAADDYGYTLTFQIKHLDYEEFNLNWCAVEMRAKIDSPNSLPISRPCTIITTPTTYTESIVRGSTTIDLLFNPGVTSIDSVIVANVTVTITTNYALDTTHNAIQWINAAPTTGTLYVVNTTFPDASEGTCIYTVANGDFTQSGKYNIELVVTNTSSNKVITAQGLVLAINKLKTI